MCGCVAPEAPCKAAWRQRMTASLNFLTVRKPPDSEQNLRGIYAAADPITRRPRNAVQGRLAPT